MIIKWFVPLAILVSLNGISSANDSVQAASPSSGLKWEEVMNPKGDKLFGVNEDGYFENQGAVQSFLKNASPELQQSMTEQQTQLKAEHTRTPSSEKEVLDGSQIPGAVQFAKPTSPAKQPVESPKTQ